MYKLFSHFLLAISILQSVTVFVFAYFRNWNLEYAVLFGSIFTFIAGLVAERLVPYRQTWNKGHGDIATDITSALVLVAVLDPLLKLISPFLVVAVYKALDTTQPTWLGDMPLLGQIILITLLIEFGRYWSHRFHHVVKPLWWLHAMHHSSCRLYLINTMRLNPINYILNFFIGSVPVLFLLPTPEALLGYFALTQPVILLQHANIDLKSGWLNYVFSTNELHRWHHSSDVVKANSNYGNAIVLWDQVFGTFRCESVHDKHEHSIGLFSSSSKYPGDAGYFCQIVTAARLVINPKQS